MKKLISVFVISSVLCFCSIAACSAKSTLTFFDTVVLRSQNEIMREDVLNRVLKEAKETSTKQSANNYSAPVFLEGTSGLKAIISGNANNFFRK